MDSNRDREYHDPDYPVQEEKRHSETNTSISREEKIIQIIKREFEREQLLKEEQALLIESRIQDAKVLLQRTRYAVVNQYYKKAEQGCGSAAATLEYGGLTAKHREQGPIHPALKRILVSNSMRPLDGPSMRTTKKIEALENSEKHASKTKLSSMEEKVNNTLMVLGINQEMNHDQIRKDIPRKSRNESRIMSRYKICVGNTSQYIGDEHNKDGVIYKWLVYIKVKSKIPIHHFIGKVRFFLHPSFKPNDVIDVSAPPFQIIRRGWGEFPIRVQLFFKDDLEQKPIQIIHNLVLDKARTGLQLMGSETIVEVWFKTAKLPNIEEDEDYDETNISNEESSLTNNNEVDTILKTIVKEEFLPINGIKNEIMCDKTPYASDDSVHRVETVTPIAKKPPKIVKKRHERSLLKPTIGVAKLPPNLELDRIRIQNEHDYMIPHKNRWSNHEQNIQNLRRIFADIEFTTYQQGLIFLLKNITIKSIPTLYNLLDIEKEQTIIRRRANEWSLAKHLSRMMKSHPSFRETLCWTTKNIVLFLRTFGYTTGGPKVDPNSLISSACDNRTGTVEDLRLWIRQNENSNKEEVNGYINVDGDEQTNKTKRSHNKISDNLFRNSETTLSHTLLDSMLSNNNLRYNFNAGGKLMLATALENFIGGIIRTAYALKPTRPNEECAQSLTNDDQLCSIELNDVNRVLTEVEIFDFLTSKHFRKTK